ncbi:MAG: glycosyltransferase [Planctomycetales bacterium]|nr:glycosyltransferase [Planctomycetales bacterium]
MKLAYLTTCFGTPSHTFIRRELREFARCGVDVRLFGIRQDPQQADDAQDLVEQTEYLYPLRPIDLLVSNLYFAVTSPKRYLVALCGCFAVRQGSFKNRWKLAFHLLISTTLARSVRRQGITHLHAHFLNVSSSIAMFCSRLTGIPYSITIHSAGEKNLPHVIAIADKLRFAQKLIMISAYNIDYYSSIFPCQKKSTVVRCGMNLEDYPFQPNDHQPGNPLRILAVGRFVEKKGFSYLIQAVKLLVESGMSADVTILGSGPLDQSLRSLVESGGLSDVVNMPGKVSSAEVRRLMESVDLVVVPSVTSVTGEMEGIPVVLMEAMALGTPVLATAHSGIPELVQPETGMLVPEQDAQALCDAIRSFQPDAQRTENARKKIEDEFEIRHVVAERRRLFEQAE